LKPLVQNALDRILQPQKVGLTRVDMRNLGSIISVRQEAELLRRIPPTAGKYSFTVEGDVIEAKSGDWIKFGPDDGAVVSDGDKKIVDFRYIWNAKI
jgi:uncharacterized protein (DUF342 family)